MEPLLKEEVMESPPASLPWFCKRPEFPAITLN
jgi:hypothetical protein